MPGAQEQGQVTPPPPPDYRGYAPSQTPPDYRGYTPSQTPVAPPQPPPQPPSWSAPTNVSSPAPEAATKTCPHCGATLARVLNFCNQCGRPLRNA